MTDDKIYDSIEKVVQPELTKPESESLPEAEPVQSISLD